MKAVRIDKFGGPEVMQIVDVPVPEPGAGQVRIRVEACGLNYSDIMIRQGMYIDAMSLPCYLGREFCGTIDKAGPGATQFAPGTRVVGTATGGALAEYVVVPAAGLFPNPPGLSPEQGASLLIQGITAVHCIDDCVALKSGETLLVHAAAGGVGTLAVQIGLARGAKVFGTASSDEKCKFVESLGATAINYTKGDWVKELLAANGGKGVNTILESVGGEVFTRSFNEALAIFGRMVVFGVASTEIVPLTNREILGSNKMLAGYYLGSFIPHHMDRVMTASMKLAQLIGQGKVKIIIQKTYPLSQAVEAFNSMQNRQSIGKIIIKP